MISSLFCRRLLLFTIWASLFWLFYALNSGITCTNDGSHFALIKSLCDRSSARLNDNIVFAQHDSALYKEQYYSDRNPGTAFLVYGFLKFSEPFKDYFKNILVDPAVPLQAYSANLVSRCLLIPPLCGSLIFICLVMIFSRLGLGHLSAVGLGLTLVLSTLILRYSTVLYSHMITAFLVSLAIFLLLESENKNRFYQLLLAAWVLSLAVLVEHPAVVLFIPLGIYCLLRYKLTLFWPSRLLLMIFAVVLPLLPLLAYNAMNFDGPFVIAHFYQTAYPRLHKLETILDPYQAPFKLWELLFGGNGFTSLFNSSPYLYLALASLLIFPLRMEKFNRVHFFLLASCLLGILPPALFSVDPGYDQDYRQALFVLPFIAVFLALGVKHILLSFREPAFFARFVFVATFLVIAIRSAQIHFEHIRHENQPVYLDYLVNSEAALRNTAPIIIAAGLMLLCWHFWLWKFRRSVCSMADSPSI